MDLPWYKVFAARACVVGERGTLRVENFIAPMVYHRIEVATPDGRRVEKLYGEGESSYELQLAAFAAAVRGEPAAAGSAEDAMQNMRVIDSIYEHAGLGKREGF